MADDKYTFGTARIRLEEIAAEVRKKDTSLEKSLDLLEEGVRLANICTELVDHTDMSAEVATEAIDAAPAVSGDAPEGARALEAGAGGHAGDPGLGAGADGGPGDDDGPADVASAE